MNAIKLEALTDAVDADPNMMEMANESGSSFPVFMTILARQAKERDYRKLTAIMLGADDPRCLKQLVDFALSHGDAAKLARAFFGNRNEDGRVSIRAKTYQRVLGLVVTEIPMSVLHEWLTVVCDFRHWTAPFFDSQGADTYWNAHIRRYVDRREPDLRRAFEDLLTAGHGIMLQEPDSKGGWEKMGHVFNVEDQALRALVKIVFLAHVTAGKLPTELPKIKPDVWGWGHRQLEVCQRTRSGVPMVYRRRVDTPNQDLIRRLAEKEGLLRQDIVDLTEEGIMLLVLSCYYQDLEFAKRRRKFVARYGEPKPVDNHMTP